MAVVRSVLLQLAVAGLCVSLCQGLYFHIGETEQKCFIEEVPAETMIVGELFYFEITLASYKCIIDCNGCLT